MLKAQYSERGPIPEQSIAAVEFEALALAEDEALLELMASPMKPIPSSWQ